MTTTYVVRNANGEVTADRTSPTMTYTHAVLVTPKDDKRGLGVFSWHTSEAHAAKAASSLTGNANCGTAVTGDRYSVVPVEAHKGAKATVLKRLAKAAEAGQVTVVEVDGVKVAETTRKDLTKPTKAKKATKATKATPAPKPTKAAAPKAPAKATGLELAQANLEAAKASPAPVHPGLQWRVDMFTKGFTQAKLAEAMGVAGMTLNRVLNGQGTAPTATLTLAYAEAMGDSPVLTWQAVADYELALALQAAQKA